MSDAVRQVVEGWMTGTTRLTVFNLNNAIITFGQGIDMRQRKREILVADGDMHECGRIAGWLEACGHSVVKTDSGTQAFAALRGGGVELAILDASLEGKSGVEILKELRSSCDECETPWMPVIIMSGGGRKTERRARMANADVFFFKPLMKETLLEAVRHLLVITHR